MAKPLSGGREDEQSTAGQGTDAKKKQEENKQVSGCHGLYFLLKFVDFSWDVNRPYRILPQGNCCFQEGAKLKSLPC
jgi:hypothetical protein